MFGAYLIPEWLSFIQSDVFVYVNGWDEENYLTWQGLEGVRKIPGYYMLNINWLFQLIGLSGAIQNLLFDTILPPLTVYFAYRSLALLNIPSVRALSYAVIIFFSSTLFNYTNPLVKWVIGPYKAQTLLGAGWELYPSVLRTPNPQISYLIISLALYVYLCKRKFWILLLPFPLLYYHVAVPALFLMTSIVIYHYLKNSKSYGLYLALLISFLTSFILVGLFVTSLSWQMGLYKPDEWLRKSDLFFVNSRQLQIPLMLAVITVVYLVFVKLRCVEKNKFHEWLLIVLTSSFGAVNLQLISGIWLCQKNYYDYGLSILFGISIVFIIEMVKNDMNRKIAIYALLITLIITTGHSQLPWYRDSKIVSKQIFPIIEQVRKDPQHAVIKDLRLSSRIAYTTAKLQAPPLSYQYNFKSIADQDIDYLPMIDSAFSFAIERAKNSEEQDTIRNTYYNIIQGRSKSEKHILSNDQYLEKYKSYYKHLYTLPSE